MRLATEADRPQIEAFLRWHLPFTMFPLSNLATYGMAGGHDFAMRFWVTGRAGMITDILAMTDGGSVLPCLPSGDYARAAQALAGQPLTAIVGPTDQVRGLERAAGLTGAPHNLDHDEPHLLLVLDRLIVPQGPGQIVPIADAPPAILYDWMEDYQRVALGTPKAEARARARQAHAAYCRLGSHVVLMAGDDPLAMTGFNAQIPDVVQIGGVYTPPDLRGRGHARRALALHLAQARDRGVRQAALFASSPVATRAYRAIGFDQIGQWTLLLFDGLQKGRT